MLFICILLLNSYYFDHQPASLFIFIISPDFPLYFIITSLSVTFIANCTSLHASYYLHVLAPPMVSEADSVTESASGVRGEVSNSPPPQVHPYTAGFGLYVAPPWRFFCVYRRGFNRHLTSSLTGDSNEVPPPFPTLRSTHTSILHRVPEEGRCGTRPMIRLSTHCCTVLLSHSHGLCIISKL